MAKRGISMRVDKDLAKIIEEFAKKNDLSIREASKEVAKTIKPGFNKLKF